MCIEEVRKKGRYVSLDDAYGFFEALGPGMVVYDSVSVEEKVYLVTYLSYCIRSIRIMRRH